MTGGPFESHTLAGRRFTCDAEDTAQLQINGKSNDVKPNGDGTNRVTQSRVAGTLEGTNIVFDPANGDDDYLVDLRNSGKFFDYSGTSNDGVIWAGSVQITGDLKFDYKAGTVPITLSGTFQKQG
ncbi:hypothetical protein FACS189447_07930 [Spirochaetia bacterium]|nr:hypothetical protein FACS189447_07930 [Spirochaetia bacterium]